MTHDPKMHNYQDDLDTNPDAIDTVTDSQTDHPAEIFGIPEDEYKDELNKIAIDSPNADEDEREYIEDSDEDPQHD